MNSFERVLFAFKDTRRTDKTLMLCCHARDFHNCTFRGKVTLKAYNATCFGDGCLNRMHNAAIGLERVLVEFFANRVARSCHAIFMQQASATQLIENNRNATGFIEVFCYVLPTWL